VVRLVRRVANPLHFGPTDWTRLFVPSVNGHSFTKRRHFFRETVTGVRTQLLRPMRQDLSRRIVEPLNFVRLQPLRQRDRRKLCVVEDLVGVCVADPAKRPWIGEGTLQRVIFLGQYRRKFFRRRGEYVNSTGIEFRERSFARDQVYRCALLRSRLGQRQRPGPRLSRRDIAWTEIKCREYAPTVWLHALRLPMQPARNHEVENEPVIVVKAD